MKRKRTIKIKKENGQIIMTNGLTELTGFENFKDARGFLKELKKSNLLSVQWFLTASKFKEKMLTKFLA